MKESCFEKAKTSDLATLFPTNVTDDDIPNEDSDII